MHFLCSLSTVITVKCIFLLTVPSRLYIEDKLLCFIIPFTSPIAPLCFHMSDIQVGAASEIQEYK